jgi:hypothetical protein
MQEHNIIIITKRGSDRIFLRVKLCFVNDLFDLFEIVNYVIILGGLVLGETEKIFFL